MLNASLKVLEMIVEKGFSAYLVGGYVRDYLLGIKSNDVDICTNATPKELVDIFKSAKIPREDYGAVTLNYKNIRFEITTFRREIKYVNNRKPEEIEYIDSLEEDLKRRDFTINTICMDKDKNIIDLLNGRKDLEEKIIRVVGDSDQKFSDDALRILRAVRFATSLNFELDDNILVSIKKYKNLLKNISYERKREELDKIFTNSRNKDGIQLLLELGLDEELEIVNLKNVQYTDSLMGIWAIIDSSVYHFTSNEKELIERIKKAIEVDNLEPINLYKYGLYANSVAGGIKGISRERITKCYNGLPIHLRREIDVSGSDISKVLGRREGAYLNKIYEDLENEILNQRINNEKEKILEYCTLKYKGEEILWNKS